MEFSIKYTYNYKQSKMLSLLTLSPLTGPNLLVTISDLSLSRDCGSAYHKNIVIL